MKKQEVIDIICEQIVQNIFEGWYDNSATPIHFKGDIHRNLGVNPLYVDNGKHSSSDNIRQVSTIDYNGESFQGEKIVFSPNKFMLYKIKNFGRDTINGSMSLFGNVKELRRAIDTVNGAAVRSGKRVYFRFITSEDNANRRDSVLTKTFCEFSFDNNTWYILIPNPVQNLKQTKLIQK